MRKNIFFAAVLVSVSLQPLLAADSNEPNNNTTTARSSMMRLYRSERAAINWHNGTQRMVVSPRLNTDANSLWIFPINCQPEQIQFNLIPKFPNFYGPNRTQQASDLLNNLNCAIIATQLWTIPICYYCWTDHPEISSGYGSFSTIDSNGVSIKILKADSTASLAQQLKEHGRSIEPSELKPYAEYLNQDYSLLTVWREKTEQDRIDRAEPNFGDPNLTQTRFRRGYHRRPCLYVEFPSEKPFYPILFTEGRPRHLTLTLTGFWQIDNPEQSKAFQCYQQVCPEAALPEAFRAFLPPKDIPYTTFTFLSTSTPLEKHLAFTPSQIEDEIYADTLSKMSYLQLILPGMVMLAIMSYLSAGICGLLVYGKWRGFATLGIMNILTIIVMTIAMNSKTSKISETIQQSKKKANLFLVLFSIVTVLLSFGVFALLKMPLQ